MSMNLIENLIQNDQKVLSLFPLSIEAWLPKGDLARFVVGIVEQLDIRSLRESDRGQDSTRYNSEILTALLFYGYVTGVFSSRKLESSIYDSAAFRYISANTHPDHDMIAGFRRRFLKELSELFVKILMIASRYKDLNYGNAGTLEAQLQAEVADLLGKAEAADRADIANELSIPEELEHRGKYLTTTIVINKGVSPCA